MFLSGFFYNNFFYIGNNMAIEMDKDCDMYKDKEMGRIWT
jgi:hypothetical protein